MLKVSSSALGTNILMTSQILLRASLAFIIYIVIIVCLENLQDIYMATSWIVLVLYLLGRKIVAFKEVILLVIGCAGLILCVLLKQYIGTDAVEIDVLRISLFAALLTVSKAHFSKCVFKVYWILKQAAEKSHVYQKLLTAKVIMLIISTLFAVSACYIAENMHMTIHKFSCAYNNRAIIWAWKLEDSDINYLANPEVTLIEISLCDDGFQEVPAYSQTEIESWPLRTDLIKRSPGEYVRLTCEARQHPFENSTDKYPVVLKDNVEIINSSRRTIHLSEYKSINTTINVVSVVMNKMKPSDFGLYRLIIRTVSRSDIPCHVSSTSTYRIVHILDRHMCEFNVQLIQEYYDYTSVSVGSLLSFQLLFFRGNHSNNIAVEHFVNGSPLESMLDISSECCLPSVNLYLGLLNEGKPDVPTLKLTKANMNYDGYDRWYIEAKVCVCPSMYGIHRFRLYSEVYHPKQKSITNEEFWHPQITVVYPKSSSLLGNTISERERHMINLSKTNNDFSLFNGSAFQYLQSAREKEFDEILYMEFRSIMYTAHFPLLVCLVVVLYLFALMGGIWIYICNKMGILIYLNPPNHGGNLANLGEVAHENAIVWRNYHYDIFVLYVEEDSDFVLYELNPCFAEQRLSIFLSEEDPPAGPTMNNLLLALTLSKKLIIVVSENFVNNKLYNNFVFPNIILRRLYEGLINCGHIMLLVCKPCRIPESLATDRRIVILDHTLNQTIIFRQKLYEWLVSPLIQQGFGLDPIVHPELQWLSQL